MAQYFKVTNISDEPFHVSYTKALLTDEQLEQYEQYKTTPEYVGIDEDEITRRKKIPEAIKARPFFEMMEGDIRVRLMDHTKDGRIPRMEWQFCIGPNVTDLLAKNKIIRARKICKDYDIPFKATDTIEVLVDKIKKKFGKNVRILNERQWLTSGIREAWEYREKEARLKAGELTAKIINVGGFLKAEEITEVDVEEFEMAQALEEENSKLPEPIMRTVISSSPTDQVVSFDRSDVDTIGSVVRKKKVTRRK